MLLAIIAKTPIVSAWGEEAWARIAAKIDNYVSILAEQQLEPVLLAVDDPLSTAKFGLNPVAPINSFILSTVNAVRSAMKTRGRAVEHVVLLGGNDLIPFFQLMNPVMDRRLDPDSLVATDNPYAADPEAADQVSEWMCPTGSLGRVCDGGSAESFEKSIQNAIDSHKNASGKSGSLAVVNREWEDASIPARNELPGPVDYRSSPAYRLTPNNAQDLASRVLYFNLHGFDGDPAWKSYDLALDQFLNVVVPDSLGSGVLTGSVVVSEACYGAQIAGRTTANCCALRMHVEGARTFWGATGLAFGSVLQPWLTVDNADRLSAHFIQGVRGGGMAGSVAAGARANFRATCAQNGGMNPYEQKTALQFVLLGDPTVTV